MITNGYDITEDVTPNVDSKFSWVYVGSLLSNRNPEILWEVFSELITEDHQFKEDLEIKLAGTLGVEVEKSLEYYTLSSYTKMAGYVSHKEALQLQHNAQVLLLLEMDKVETKAIIPGKLFEYIRAGRPIVALGPMGSDIQQIIEETNTGCFFHFSEKEKLKKQIRMYYQEFKKGQLSIQSTTSIEKYSRRFLTGEMAKLL